MRKGRKVFVRKPEPNEKNANNLLIQKGAIPVDFNGIEITSMIYSDQTSSTSFIQKPLVSIDNVDDRILKVLEGRTLSAEEILDKSGLDWPPKKLTAHLQKMKKVQTVKNGRTNLYILKAHQVEQPILFR